MIASSSTRGRGFQNEIFAVILWLAYIRGAESLFGMRSAAVSNKRLNSIEPCI